MTARVQEKKIKAHTRLKMNAFYYGQDKTMCTFSACVTFNNPTDGQTDIIRDRAETLSSMSLSVDRVEMFFRKQQIDKLLFLNAQSTAKVINDH